MNSISWKSTLSALEEVTRAYGVILFLNSPVAGAVLLLISLYQPNIGFSGLLAVFTSLLITRVWKLPDYAARTQIFNSLLVGLSLGAFYVLNLQLMLIIVLGAVLTSLVSTMLSDWAWRGDKLPALSLPFVLVAGLMAIVA